MPQVLLTSVLSKVKGHHEYQYPYEIGEYVVCMVEANNAHSDNAIIVKSNQGVTLGHVPERLARILKPLIEEGRIHRVVGKITGHARPAPQGTWVRGGGIEIPCKYKLYGSICNKQSVIAMLQ